MNKDIVKSLREDSRFIEFQVFILQEMDKLNSIDGLENLSTMAVGETVRARAIALSTLQNILDPFLNFKEKNKASDEEIKQAKAKVGL